MRHSNFNTEAQDLKILVYPIGILFLVIELAFPITSYLEVEPIGIVTTLDPDATRWHWGLIPLWQYNDFHIANWHPINVVVICATVALWGGLIYWSRRT